jgi:hypothetical protein
MSPAPTVWRSWTTRNGVPVAIMVAVGCTVGTLLWYERDATEQWTPQPQDELAVVHGLLERASVLHPIHYSLLVLPDVHTRFLSTNAPGHLHATNAIGPYPRQFWFFPTNKPGSYINYQYGLYESLYRVVHSGYWLDEPVPSCLTGTIAGLDERVIGGEWDETTSVPWWTNNVSEIGPPHLPYLSWFVACSNAVGHTVTAQRASHCWPGVAYTNNGVWWFDSGTNCAVYRVSPTGGVYAGMAATYYRAYPYVSTQAYACYGAVLSRLRTTVKGREDGYDWDIVGKVPGTSRLWYAECTVTAATWQAALDAAVNQIGTVSLVETNVNAIGGDPDAAGDYLHIRIYPYYYTNPVCTVEERHYARAFGIRDYATNVTGRAWHCIEPMPPFWGYGYKTLKGYAYWHPLDALASNIYVLGDVSLPCTNPVVGVWGAVTSEYAAVWWADSTNRVPPSAVPATNSAFWVFGGQEPYRYQIGWQSRGDNARAAVRWDFERFGSSGAFYGAASSNRLGY